MKKIKFALFILLIISLLLNGCIERKSLNSSAGVKRDYIVYNIGKFPQSLSMIDNDETRSKDFLYALYEGLVKTDENNKIVPGLAESWNISKDEIAYTFKLRETAKWSNGEDITAEDFVKLFSSILYPKTVNIYADELLPIFGLQEYRTGKKNFNNVAIRAVDKKNLEIRLNYPCSFLLNILAAPQYSLRKFDENLDKWKEDYKSLSFSGPFQIDNINDKGEVTLLKNKNYWNGEDVKSEKIILTSIESSESALANFENGKIDMLTFPPVSEVKRLKEDGKILDLNSDVRTSLIFNLKTSEMMMDINVRKAISSILNDKNQMQKYLSNNNEESPNGKAKKNVTNDNGVETAKKFLKDSKYNKKYKIRLIYLNTSEDAKQCEAISKALKEILNMSIELKGYDKEQLNTAITNGEYDILKKDFAYNYGDDNGFLEKWTSNYNKDNYGYKNQEYDNIVSKLKFENDKIKKDELIKKGEDILIKEIPFIQLSYKTITILREKDVDGLYITREGNLRLDRIYKKNLF